MAVEYSLFTEVHCMSVAVKYSPFTEVYGFGC